jgi:hypothetical protein
MNVGGRHTQTRRHARRQMQLRTGGCCRAACPAWVASVLDLNGRCEARRGEVRSPPVSLCFSEYSKAFLLANDNSFENLASFCVKRKEEVRRATGCVGSAVAVCVDTRQGRPRRAWGQMGARCCVHSIPFHRRPCLSAEGPRRR